MSKKKLSEVTEKNRIHFPDFFLDIKQEQNFKFCIYYVNNFHFKTFVKAHLIFTVKKYTVSEVNYCFIFYVILKQ